MKHKYRLILWQDPYVWRIRDDDEELTYHESAVGQAPMQAVANLAKREFKRAIAYRFRPMYDPTDK